MSWLVRFTSATNASSAKTRSSTAKNCSLSRTLDWDGDAWVVYGYWLTDVSSGIRYVPQYVLTQDQVDAVGRGALSMIGKLNGIR
jgi:hypothetical protein